MELQKSQTQLNTYTHTHKFSILFSFLLCIFKSFHFEKIKYTCKKLACSISLKDWIFSYPLMKRVRVLNRFSHVQPMMTLCAVARQVLLSTGFSRQENWSGFARPPPGGLPHPGIKAGSLPPAPPGKEIKCQQRNLGRRTDTMKVWLISSGSTLRKKLWTHIHTHIPMLTNRPPS